MVRRGLSGKVTGGRTSRPGTVSRGRSVAHVAGFPVQEAPAAARLTLREHGIPGHRSAWWLDRHNPKPHHLGWDAWLADVITKRRLALLVVSDVQHVLAGKGSRSVHRTWNWLITQHPEMLLILIGDQLLPAAALISGPRPWPSEADQAATNGAEERRPAPLLQLAGRPGRPAHQDPGRGPGPAAQTTPRLSAGRPGALPRQQVRRPVRTQHVRPQAAAYRGATSAPGARRPAHLQTLRRHHPPHRHPRQPARQRARHRPVRGPVVQALPRRHLRPPPPPRQPAPGRRPHEGADPARRASRPGQRPRRTRRLALVEFTDLTRLQGGDGRVLADYALTLPGQENAAGKITYLQAIIQIDDLLRPREHLPVSSAGSSRRCGR